MNEHSVQAFSLFSEYDIYLFKSGKHHRLYDKLGAHLAIHEGAAGVHFAVWSPNANQVSVIGDFNDWADGKHRLIPRLDGSGIWEGFIAGLGKGTLYKYKIHSNNYGQVLEKGDPFALLWETPPKTASVVWDLEYKWQDKKWLQQRGKSNALDAPYAVYEVHLGSWRRKAEDNYRSLHYTELATELVSYVKEMGYTHVEMMPVMEHPFFGSWGYQVTGYFAPSARYGTPQEFMYLIDAFHEAGIGVILDWVPSHFPTDAFGLANFDGTALYEHADPRQGFHPDWGSYIFNYGRNEVRSFLISNALFWLDKYHADGLRVDAVASMLYLDYSRKEGEWIPNTLGGRENLEAISFLKEMNEVVYQNFPDVQTIAEESTAWTGVSRPTFTGGLGFGMKWMMGWMNDTLLYFAKDSIYRQYHHHTITFSLVYAFTENFMLPLSHDEVVHGKGALLQRMPGDEWQRFANLRLLFAYMYTHPGTKLMFMGGEIGQPHEWNHDGQIAHDLLQYPLHKGMKSCVQALNHLYRQEKGLYELPFAPEGFEWIDLQDYQSSVLVWIRKGKSPEDMVIVVANFTPTVRDNYRIGVPEAAAYKEIFNSDAPEFGGSGIHNAKKIKVQDIVYHGRTHSLSLVLPPLGLIVLKPENLVLLSPVRDEIAAMDAPSTEPAKKSRSKSTQEDEADAAPAPKKRTSKSKKAE